MYPWDADAARRAARRAEDATAPDAGPAPESAQAIQAVQVALDRRDNGGDAAGAPAPVLARQ
jgi:hypothetical protein